jgi:hypothetical protein
MFTHAKITIRFSVVGPKMPDSSVMLVGAFDDAIRNPTLRPLYEAAGIVEVGMPMITVYSAHEEGDRAKLKLECWVYGNPLVPGNIVDIFLGAVAAPSTLEALRARSAGEDWGVERVLGPGYRGAPVASPSDFRLGTHAQKKRYRCVDTSSPITMINGFAVSELCAADVAADGAAAEGGKGCRIEGGYSI